MNPPCEACTFQNPPGARECAMCGETLTLPTRGGAGGGTGGRGGRGNYNLSDADDIQRMFDDLQDVADEYARQPPAEELDEDDLRRYMPSEVERRHRDGGYMALNFDDEDGLDARNAPRQGYPYNHAGQRGGGGGGAAATVNDHDHEDRRDNASDHERDDDEHNESIRAMLKNRGANRGGGQHTGTAAASAATTTTAAATSAEDGLDAADAEMAAVAAAAAAAADRENDADDDDDDDDDGGSTGAVRDDLEDVDLDARRPLLVGPAPTSDWQCQHCTMWNVAGLRLCHMCEYPASLPVDVGGSGGGSGNGGGSRGGDYGTGATAGTAQHDAEAAVARLFAKVAQADGEDMVAFYMAEYCSVPHEDGSSMFAAHTFAVGELLLLPMHDLSLAKETAVVGRLADIRLCSYMLHATGLDDTEPATPLATMPASQAVYLAAMYGRPVILTYLLAAGGDPTKVDVSGRVYLPSRFRLNGLPPSLPTATIFGADPYSVAASQGFPNICQALRNAGAKPTVNNAISRFTQSVRRSLLQSDTPFAPIPLVPHSWIVSEEELQKRPGDRLVAATLRVPYTTGMEESPKPVAERKAVDEPDSGAPCTRVPVIAQVIAIDDAIWPAVIAAIVYNISHEVTSFIGFSYVPGSKSEIWLLFQRTSERDPAAVVMWTVDDMVARMFADNEDDGGDFGNDDDGDDEDDDEGAGEDDDDDYDEGEGDDEDGAQ